MSNELNTKLQEDMLKAYNENLETNEQDGIGKVLLNSLLREIVKSSDDDLTEDQFYYHVYNLMIGGQFFHREFFPKARK